MDKRQKSEAAATESNISTQRGFYVDRDGAGFPSSPRSFKRAPLLRMARQLPRLWKCFSFVTTSG